MGKVIQFPAQPRPAAQASSNTSAWAVIGLLAASIALVGGAQYVARMNAGQNV